MKFKIINIIIFFIAISINPMKAQVQPYRNVIWVHGYEGNIDSWKHYENIFTAERKMNGYRKGYNSMYGIDYAATQVYTGMLNDMGYAGAKDPRNIAVAHSMGGLTAREVDKMSNGTHFGGIITVCTPNYGAPIANSVADGSVTQEFNKACNELTVGPDAQLYPTPWFIEGNITNEFLCTQLRETFIIDALFDNPETRADLQVGSNFVNELNSYNSTIPHISIWAEETTPVHWRFAGSTYSNEENDTDIIDIVGRIKAAYKGHYDYNRGLALANPLMAPAYLYIASQWKRGLDWINKSETTWNTLIKTSRRETITTQNWEYTCVYDWPEPATKVIPDECTWQWVLVTRTETVTVNYPSDGFIPKYSQIEKGLSIRIT